MKKINKNILIGLGTITVLTAPLITVVSCGSKPHKDDGKDNNNDNDGNNNSTTAVDVKKDKNELTLLTKNDNIHDTHSGHLTFDLSDKGKGAITLFDKDNNDITDKNGSFKIGDKIYFKYANNDDILNFTIKEGSQNIWKNEVILADGSTISKDLEDAIDDVDTEISKTKGWTDDLVQEFKKLKLKTISFPHLKTLNISNLGLFSFTNTPKLIKFNIPKLNADVSKYKFGPMLNYDKNTIMTLPAGFKDKQKLEDMFGIHNSDKHELSELPNIFPNIKFV